MGKPIPYDYRVKIVERRKTGESYNSIALDLNLSESGVKKIWYKYKKVGEAAFKADYSNCGPAITYGEDTCKLLDEVRDNKQGADYVRSKLLMKYPDKKIPSTRTINRLWVKQGTNREKGRPTNVEKKVE